MAIRTIVFLLTTATVLLVGGLLTYLTVRAARRTKATPLWILASGFTLVTVGTVVAELCLLGLPASFEGLDVIVSIVIAIGFAVTGYSVYGGYS